MFKRSLRILRFVDDLAEALIIHVLLATPARRKFCAGVLTLGGLAAYLFSGFLVAPPPVDASVGSQAFAAPIAPFWDDVGTESVTKAADTGRVDPGDHPAVQAGILANADSLARARIECNRPGGFRFDVTPNYRTLRRMGNLLIARGVLAIQEEAAGQSPETNAVGIAGYQPICILGGDRAIHDFLAARNLGRAVARGAGDGPYLIDMMVGLAIERRAVQAMTRFAQSGRMTRSQALWMALDSPPARDSAGRLAAVLGNETRFAQRVVRHFAATNAWPDSPDTALLRLWMPWRQAARAAAARKLEDKLATAYQPAIDLLASRGSMPSPEELPPAAASEIGAAEAVMACFSAEKGVELSVRLVDRMAMPNVRSAANRLAQFDRETEALYDRCRASVREERMTENEPE